MNPVSDHRVYMVILCEKIYDWVKQKIIDLITETQGFLSLTG